MDVLLLHTHSILRWLLFVTLVAALVKSIAGLAGNKPYTPADKKMALFTLIFTHLQLVIGLILYFVSPNVDFHFDVSMKSETLRFFTVEHITAMLLAIALITVGYSRAKRAVTDKAKFKSIAVFFGIALLIILAMVPWPFHFIAPVTGGWY